MNNRDKLIEIIKNSCNLTNWENIERYDENITKIVDAILKAGWIKQEEKRSQINLKQLREQIGLTQKDVANMLEISERVYAYYENGRLPRKLETLLKLSEIFDVSINELYTIKTNPVPEQKESKPCPKCEKQFFLDKYCKDCGRQLFQIYGKCDKRCAIFEKFCVYKLENNCTNPSNVLANKDDALFCRKCGAENIPNDANYEMRKEGYYSHSHICPNKEIK